ncbi:MAG: insulinase family protein [Spirochaetia bacterium]|nr:insulinase family protein [Spirochaetia bacterium]
MSFTLIEERFIHEIDSTARLYRHDATGARLLSLSNKDENKAFGIGFRTPPSRSDGVAHILEHSVLCGSKKYPVKEPFVELMKGSLNTFLNAFTYPDKTVYPVASTNKKDFYNLTDVYMDAVLNPLISEDTFRQEGWHYEVDPKSGDLSYKGVVFNEMKGAYSDPDDLHDDLCRRSLFPDSPYGLDSGGDPRVIPHLSYAEFKAFHETYYHPSNAFIYFYGDDDPEERLAFLERWLADYTRLEVASLPAPQPAFKAPVYKSAFYEGKDPKAWTAINWALGEHGDHKTSLGLAILSHILLATPASPLRKALIDSGIGEDLAGFGLEESLRTMAWSVGLKGVHPDKTAEVEALVLKELSRLAGNGIDRNTVEASLNTVEFAMREKNTGRFPRGLAIYLEALNDWLYELNPLDALAFEHNFEAIKAEALGGKGYFEGLIKKWFLDNPHRSTVTILPDPEEGSRREAEEKEALAKVKASLSEAELKEIEASARRLKALQEKPDSPEALASIPGLSLQDLPRESARLPAQEDRLGGIPLLYHDLPTSSILYLDLAFSLKNLPERLLPYLGVLGRVLLETGTETLDYVALSQELGKHTGGIRTNSLLTTAWKKKEAVSYFLLRAKAMTGKLPKLLELLSSVLLSARLDNKERFKQIVLEEKAQSEASFIPAGHAMIGQRLLSRLSESERKSEMINGLEQLYFLRALALRIETDWKAVLAELEETRDAIINASGCVANVTIDKEDFAKLKPELEAFAAKIPGAGAVGKKVAATREASASVAAAWADSPHADVAVPPPPPYEYLTAPSQVNYVGRAFPTLAEASGAFLVAKKYLDTAYLWEKVRVQGGAYGGFSTYDLNSGNFMLLSYRDPNLETTFDIFDTVSEYLEKIDIPREELERAIIGTIGGVDAYLLPDMKGYISLVYHLTGYRHEDRQRMRDQILAASAADFHALGKAITEARIRAVSGALGSAQRIEALPETYRRGAQIKPVL